MLTFILFLAAMFCLSVVVFGLWYSRSQIKEDITNVGSSLQNLFTEMKDVHNDSK